MSAILALSVPEDDAPVRNIVGALSESDLDVYWDRAAPAGGSARLDSARCLVLFWSAAAAADEAYVEQARRAIAAGKAICVRLEGAPLPESLSGCTLYDLRGWRARASSLFMLDLVAGVKAKAAGLDPPLPRAPRQLLFRRLAIAVPSAVAAIALVVGLYRDVGMDRIPGAAEKRAWAAVRPGSCEDLRSFLRGHSDGVLAPRAQALLGARTVSTVTEWQPAERPLPLYVAASEAVPAANEAAARDAALSRAEEAANRACQGLARAGGARLEGALTRPRTYSCERFSAGTVCALDGEALCRLREPVVVEAERCG